MLFKMAMRSRGKNARPKQPPGPWKLPLLQLLKLGPLMLWKLAQSHVAKKHGPLMHLRLGDVSTLVLSSSDIAEEFMKTIYTV